MDSSIPPSPPPAKKPKMSTTATSDEEENPKLSSEGPANRPRRFKRRKIAIMLAYCGAGYQGMQKNPGAKTIEGDLEEALFLSAAVPEADRGCPKRWDWARSARTDKGVSAVGQVVSGRFYVDPPGLVDRLNSHLGPQIRVFGYKRVTASFNAKKLCDRRRYVYLLPVFALDPNSHRDRESVIASFGSGNELAKCSECPERGRKVVGVMGRWRADGENGSSANLVEEFAENNQSYGLGTRVDCKKGVAELAVENESARELNIPSEEGKEANLDFVKNGDEGGVEHYVDSYLEMKNSTDEEQVEENDSNSGKKDALFREKGGDEKIEENVSFDDGFSGRDSAETDKTPRTDSCDGSNEPSFGASKSSTFIYGEKERDRFNKILKCYVGTHNFHNFTSRTKAEDPSARRYIVSFFADDVVNVDGIEFVRCEVVGQSFMLHQIRKMVGLAVAVMRTCAPESLIETALKKDVNLNVPTAPEVGLYLDECLFTSYNQKWKESHEELSMKPYIEEAEDFKMKYVYSNIASMERKEGVVALWLHSLNCRNYPDFCLIESNGTDSKEVKMEG